MLTAVTRGCSGGRGAAVHAFCFALAAASAARPNSSAGRSSSLACAAALILPTVSFGDVDDFRTRLASECSMNRLGYAVRRPLYRIVGKVGISAGGLDVGMTKDGSDHLQCVAARQSD